jgi:hypothetical protein
MTPNREPVTLGKPNMITDRETSNSHPFTVDPEGECPVSSQSYIDCLKGNLTGSDSHGVAKSAVVLWPIRPESVRNFR